MEVCQLHGTLMISLHVWTSAELRSILQNGRGRLPDPLCTTSFLGFTFAWKLKSDEWTLRAKWHHSDTQSSILSQEPSGCGVTTGVKTGVKNNHHFFVPKINLLFHSRFCRGFVPFVNSFWSIFSLFMNHFLKNFPFCWQIQSVYLHFQVKRYQILTVKIHQMLAMRLGKLLNFQRQVPISIYLHLRPRNWGGLPWSIRDMFLPRATALNAATSDRNDNDWGNKNFKGFNEWVWRNE